MSNDRVPGGLTVDPLALLVVILLFGEDLLFGIVERSHALICSILQLALLAGLIALSRGAQPPRAPLRGPGLLFGAVLALGVLSILPVGAPLAHPLWDLVQTVAPGAPKTISLEPVLTRMSLLQLAGLAALFLVGVTLGWERERADRFVTYLTWGGIAYCLWSGVAWLTSPAAIFGVPRPYGGERLAGSFFSANTAATLYAVLATFGLMGVIRPLMRALGPGERLRLSSFGKSWPQLVLLALALTCLFLSTSRGGLLALTAAVMLALALMTWMKTSRGSLSGGLLAVVFAVLCLGAAAVIFGGQATTGRLQATNPMNEDRLQIFAAYWPTFQKAPWFGYGLGTFRDYNQLSMNGQNAEMLSRLGAVHNGYLEWLLEMGVTGAVCMFGAALWISLATVRGVARRSSQQALGIACVASTVVFAVHSLSDFALETPSLSATLAVIMGLGFGLAERPGSGVAMRRRRKPAPA